MRRVPYEPPGEVPDEPPPYGQTSATGVRAAGLPHGSSPTPRPRRPAWRAAAPSRCFRPAGRGQRCADGRTAVADASRQLALPLAVGAHDVPELAHAASRLPSRPLGRGTRSVVNKVRMITILRTRRAGLPGDASRCVHSTPHRGIGPRPKVPKRYRRMPNGATGAASGATVFAPRSRRRAVWLDDRDAELGSERQSLSVGPRPEALAVSAPGPSVASPVEGRASRL